MRQDRLGSLYGVFAVGVISKPRDDMSFEAICDFERALYRRIAELSDSKIAFLRSVLGVRFDRIMRCIELEDKKIEDTEQNIRILGMLCQTVEWAQASRLLIRKGSFCAIDA